MTGTITAIAPLRPARSRSEAKAETTDKLARAIIAAETEKRDSKTAKLRRARLKEEAKAEPAPGATAKRSRSKATGQRRARSPR